MNTINRFFIVLAVIIFSTAPIAAFAAYVEFGKSISIPTTERTPENAYLAGGQIIFSTTAQKDLVAAGGQVTVNGPVWGDALAAGGVVQILEEVRGDVRAAGGQVTVAKNVNGDVIVLGGEVHILSGAVVGGDVIAAGGEVTIEGAVNGSVRAYGGDIVVNGFVAGPVSIKAGRSVAFGEAAVLGDTLAYRAPAEATVAPGAKIGDRVTFEKSEAWLGGFGAQALAGFLSFLLFVKFVGILIAALALVLVFRTFSSSLVERTVGEFWKMAGIGFVALVVVPVLAALLALTVVGLYLAFALGLLYVLCLLVASAYLGVFAGALLSQWIRKEAIVNWQWTLLGVVAVFVLFFVPIVGWIADTLLFFAAFGTIARSVLFDIETKMQG